MRSEDKIVIDGVEYDWYYLQKNHETGEAIIDITPKRKQTFTVEVSMVFVEDAAGWQLLRADGKVVE